MKATNKSIRFTIVIGLFIVGITAISCNKKDLEITNQKNLSEHSECGDLNRSMTNDSLANLLGHSFSASIISHENLSISDENLLNITLNDTSLSSSSKMAILTANTNLNNFYLKLMYYDNLSTIHESFFSSQSNLDNLVSVILDDLPDLPATGAGGCVQAFNDCVNAIVTMGDLYIMNYMTCYGAYIACVYLIPIM